VAADAHYTPNENDLQVTTLNSLLADLRARNKAVVAAITSLSNARIARDTLLYAANTGWYDTAQSVKQYLKSLVGATSPQYRQVSGIKFTSRA
jgi:3-dehydroquinate synthase class II